MSDLHNIIFELECQAADHNLRAALAADAKVREENRHRAIRLQEQAWAIREEHSLRLTA